MGQHLPLSTDSANLVVKVFPLPTTLRPTCVVNVVGDIFVNFGQLSIEKRFNRLASSIGRA